MAPSHRTRLPADTVREAESIASRRRQAQSIASVRRWPAHLRAIVALSVLLGVVISACTSGQGGLNLLSPRGSASAPASSAGGSISSSSSTSVSTAAPTEAPTSTPAPTAAATPVAVVLRLAHCATTYGLAETPPPLPATVTVMLPAALARDLAAYGNDTQTVVAPPGWLCSAAVGADGTSSMTVKALHDAHALVSTQVYASCYGCIVGLAAPFFPDAEKMLEELLGPGGAAARPAEETVRQLSSDAVYFEDPPLVKGSGDGSGGPYRARGVVVFQETDPQNLFAAQMTCVMPDSEAALCNPVLNAFLDEVGTKARL